MTNFHQSAAHYVSSNQPGKVHQYQQGQHTQARDFRAGKPAQRRFLQYWVQEVEKELEHQSGNANGQHHQDSGAQGPLDVSGCPPQQALPAGRWGCPLWVRASGSCDHVFPSFRASRERRLGTRQQCGPPRSPNSCPQPVSWRPYPCCPEGLRSIKSCPGNSQMLPGNART